MGIFLDGQIAQRIPHLNHRSLADEQPGQLNRFFERAAPVLAQVKDQPLDI